MADDIVKMKIEAKIQSEPNYSNIVSSVCAIEFVSWWIATKFRQQNLPERQAEFSRFSVLKAVFWHDVSNPVASDMRGNGVEYWGSGWGIMISEYWPFFIMNSE